MGGIGPCMFRLADYVAQEPPVEKNNNTEPLMLMGVDGFEFEPWKRPPQTPEKLTPLERKARCRQERLNRSDEKYQLKMASLIWK